MNTKTTTNKVVFAVHILLVIYCILSCVYTIVMGGGGGAQRVPAVVSLAALCATFYYMFSGYKKSAAKSFKAMMILCGAASLMCLIPHTYSTATFVEDVSNSVWIAGMAVSSIIFALCFGLYLILAFVPDLGRSKSMCIIAFIFITYLAILIIAVVFKPGAMISDTGTRYDSMRIMRYTTMVTLAANAAVCNYFKYEDKAVRAGR